MTAAWALGLLLVAQPAPSGPRLTYQDGRFTIEAAGTRESVSVSAPGWSLPASQERLVLEVPGGKLEFDREGLHLTKGRQRSTSRLLGLATSTDLFTEAEISETNRRLADGRRTKEVSAVSGHAVQGSQVFLLMRWDERGGAKWLELVVRVDMADDRPTAHVLGRLAGFSFARGRVSDRMRLDAGHLEVPVQNAEGWGLARWSLADDRGAYSRFGDPVSDAFFFGSLDTLLSLRRTDYGTTIVGIKDPGRAESRLAVEFRGRLLGALPTRHIRFVRGANQVLFNLESGAELAVDPLAEARGVQAGILVWSPADKPTSATLLTPNFRRLASWSRPAPR